MGNILDFSNVLQYKVFEYVLCLLYLSECAILLFAYLGKKREKSKLTDSGTVWLIVLGWIGSIILSLDFGNSSVPNFIRTLVFPHFVYYIGIIFIIFGIIVRSLAVWTLKNAFTHTVQTSEDQHLIKNGLYRYMRNPAYTGSIISLLGVAFACRHILAPICVFIICMFCYGIRIKVEEMALKDRFEQEFTEYCTQTKFRLFPYIF